MPNIIRRPRSRQPERRHDRACAPGTHLTYEERRRIYRLSQDQGCSQRGIATTLQLPRTTVQSAIHAMSGTRRKQQSRTRTLITPVPDSVLAAASGQSAVHKLSVFNKGIQIQMAFQQPRLPNLTSATPSVSPIATSMLDDHHSQPSQPAVAGSHWGNPQLNDLLTECSNLQRFNGHEGAFGASLPPRPPKLAPMEPRVIYESS
ncbi:hypothetical protein BU23DRAFT_558424 [Bimuria novae-zelandiae CBS 107.79]|uniref:Transposase IS30-like HTH domain-containing protein n=1 Tax=Bimuria novae-zelandiae CBS 107.79 TaxID=1447943 RepID=A0A6A5V5E1_9PLEO|nr:hypothetical protein BU23DRAFT_558424 [Bimuria novae-zelandiae CBS 107.79]